MQTNPILAAGALDMAKKKLPRGLREFGGSLTDPRFSPELMRRLLDLPENSLSADVARHAEALRAAENLKLQYEAAVRRAGDLAESTFRHVLKNWTVEEIQKATGYDEE